MTDALSHEILTFEGDPEQPPEYVPIDVLRSGLESDDSRIRTHAARVAASYVPDDVTEMHPLVPTLTERLTDDKKVIVTKSVIALSIVAEDEPSIVVDAVPKLVDLLSDDLPLIRVFAGRTLGHVAVDDPDVLLGHEDSLLVAFGLEVREPFDRQQLRDEAPTAKNFETLDQANVEGQRRQITGKSIAANLLVEIAEVEPQRLVPYGDQFVEALDADWPVVVGASLDILGQIASVDPDAAIAAVEPACDSLSSTDDAIVATAITTLGYLGDSRAIEPLEALAADEDRDENLRDLAAETADFIESADDS